MIYDLLSATNRQVVNILIGFSLLHRLSDVLLSQSENTLLTVFEPNLHFKIPSNVKAMAKS